MTPEERLAEIYTAMQNDTANLATARTALVAASTALVAARAGLAAARARRHELLRADIVDLVGVKSTTAAAVAAAADIGALAAGVAEATRRVKILEESLAAARRDYDALAASLLKPKNHKRSARTP